MADTPLPDGRASVPGVIALLANPGTSYWLKDALVTALKRDPFDAERDALTLAAVLSQHLDALIARHFPDRAGT